MPWIMKTHVIVCRTTTKEIYSYAVIIIDVHQLMISLESRSIKYEKWKPTKTIRGYMSNIKNIINRKLHTVLALLCNNHIYSSSQSNL